LVSPSFPDLHLQQAQQGSKLCLTAQDQGPGLKGLTAFDGYVKFEPVFSKNKSGNSIQKKQSITEKKHPPSPAYLMFLSATGDNFCCP